MNDVERREEPTVAASLEILLVEDNDCDVLLARTAFARTGLPVKLHSVHDGEECLRYLRGQGEWCGASLPDLVLLDINMPLLNGYEALEAIAADPDLCHLPVIILSTSNNEKDVVNLYRLRCSSYIIKPLDFHAFQDLMKGLVEYWMNVVQLPREGLSRRRLAEAEAENY